jgi:RHS repeat-associated protein
MLWTMCMTRTASASGKRCRGARRPDKNVPYAQVLEERWTRGGQTGVTSYVYGDDLISHTTNGVPHDYLADGLGSTRALTDATGAVTDAYTYDGYGLLQGQTGATVNPYLYRGEQYDPALNAYYLRARYYQPGMGRFLTTDPVEGMTGDSLSEHQYLYGYCNPINNIDPSGKITFNETLVAGAIVLNTAGIAFSFTGVGGEFYALMGEKWFPDAYVFGINGYMSQRDLLCIVTLEINILIFKVVQHSLSGLIFNEMLNLRKGGISYKKG